MANDVTAVTSGVQPYVIGDRAFRGIDTYNDSNKLEAGYATVINNMQLDGGSLVLRNGWQGLRGYSELNVAPITVTFTGGGSANINASFPFTLAVGQAVKFETTGTFPTSTPIALNSSFTYYVVGTPSSSVINIAATVGGTAMTFTGGTGPFTLIPQVSDPIGIYEMTPIKNADGVTSDFVYTSVGKLFRYTTSTNATTQLADYGTGASPLYSPNVRMVTYGKYVYGVPGKTITGADSTLPLFRTDGTVGGTIQIPQIVGFPNLKPLARPYSFSQYSIPPVSQHQYIDSNVGPILVSGAESNKLDTSDFTAYAVNYNAWSGTWKKIAGDPVVKGVGVTNSNTNFLSTDQNIYSPPNQAATRIVQIDGTGDGIYQDIPSGSVTAMPYEQTNYINNNNSTSPFSCSYTNLGDTVTSTNHSVRIGQRLRFGTTTGIPSADMWVVAIVDANSFKISQYNNGTPTTFSATTSNTYYTVQGTGMFLFSMWAINVDQQTSTVGQSISVTVQGYKSVSGSAVAIPGAYVSTVIAPPIARKGDDWIKANVLCDFRVYQNEIVQLRVSIQNVNAREGDGKGIYITKTSVYAVSPRLNTVASDAIDNNTGLVKIKAMQNNTNVVGYAGLLKNCAFKFTMRPQTTVTFAAGTLVTAPGNFSPVLAVGTPVRFATTNTLPPEINTTTTYYVVFTSSVNMRIALSRGGTPITFTGGGTGTHSVTPIARDWSKYDSLSLKTVFPAFIQSSIPNIKIGLQEETGYIEWGGYGSYDSENGYMTWSLRGFTSTKMDAVSRVYFMFDGDIQNLFDGQDLMYIGDIVINGNLSPAIKYKYRFSRWYPEDGASAPFVPGIGTGSSTTYFNGFESELTGVSNELTATEALSANQIVLNPNTETINSPAAYTHLIIYRSSTAYPDGLYRCIGSYKVSDSTTNGTNLEVLSTTGGQITLLDNVPESAMLSDGPQGSQGDIYESGQDNFPVGCTSIATHQQRLWVGKNNTLWTSWLFNADNEYTINTTHVPLLTDPKVDIKGASFDVASANDKELIVSMMSYHGDMMSRNNSTTSVLLVFREGTVYPVTGFGPTSWSIQAFLRETGIGLLAPRCHTTVMGQPWYLNTTGLVQFAGTQVIPKSIQLDGLISLNPYRVLSGEVSITSSYYKRSIISVHDKKVYMFAPSNGISSSTGNRTAYVWDTRISGWVTLDAPGDITSAVSLATSNDRETFYIGDTTGQIHQVGSYYDSTYTYKPSSVTSSTLSFTGTKNTTGLAINDPIIITSAGNGLVLNTVYYIKTVTNNSVTLSSVIDGAELVLITTGPIAQFRTVDTITWELITRAYGQAYADGIAYYAKNRPYQLDIHAEGDDTNGSSVGWALLSPGGQSQINKSYTFTGKKARAIRGVSRDLSDFNWQIRLAAPEALFAFRLYAVHLHMIESGIQRHR